MHCCLSGGDSAGAATRHRAGELTCRLSSSWPLRWASSISLLPFPFLAPRGAREQSRATARRRSPRRPSFVTPPPFPHSSNPPEAPPPHPLPPTPCPEPDFAVPRPESRPQSPAAINPNPALRPSVEPPLPAILHLIREHGEHPGDPLVLPDPFPLRSGRRHRWNVVTPPRQPRLRRALAACCPCTGPRSADERPCSTGPPALAAALPCLAAGWPPPAGNTAAAACLATHWPWRKSRARAGLGLSLTSGAQPSA